MNNLRAARSYSYILCFLYLTCTAPTLKANLSLHVKSFQASLKTLKEKLVSLAQKLNEIQKQLTTMPEINPEDRKKLTGTQKFLGIPQIIIDSKDCPNYEKLFEKLRTYGPNNPNAPGLNENDFEVFTNLKTHKTVLKILFNNYIKKIASNTGDYKDYPFNWCNCEDAPVANRLLLILCQLNDISETYKNKSQKIVHTAFAEGFCLLQSWFLINALIKIGYTDLCVNIIGTTILNDFTDKAGFTGKPSKEQVAKLLHDKLPDNTKVTIKIYEHGHDYILDKNALKSHSFDIIDIGGIDAGQSLIKIKDNYWKYGLLTLQADWITDSGIQTTSPIAHFYISHHTQPNIEMTPARYARKPFDKIDGNPITEILTQAQNEKLQSKEEIITWFTKSQRETINNKVKESYPTWTIDFTLAINAQTEFQQIVDLMRINNNDIIIYDANDKKVTKWTTGYSPNKDNGFLLRP
ncbi:MAG: hypothetical protein ABH827_03535 [bacterium]